MLSKFSVAVARALTSPTPTRDDYAPREEAGKVTLAGRALMNPVRKARVAR